MATKGQIQAFAAEWGNAAQQASQQLGIPAIDILGQWGMESNYGTEMSGANNPGNVGNLGGGHFVDYPSQSSFVSAYVAATKNDFPYFQHPFKGATIANIFGGVQRYNPGNNSYNVNVQNGVNGLLGAGGPTVSKLVAAWKKGVYANIPPIGQPNDPTSDPIGTTSSGILGSALSGLSSWVLPVVWAIVALVLFVIGILLMVKASPTDALKVAMPETSMIGKAAEVGS